jgi:hypothetical protein
VFFEVCDRIQGNSPRIERFVWPSLADCIYRVEILRWLNLVTGPWLHFHHVPGAVPSHSRGEWIRTVLIGFLLFHRRVVGEGLTHGLRGLEWALGRRDILGRGVCNDDSRTRSSGPGSAWSRRMVPAGSFPEDERDERSVNHGGYGQDADRWRLHIPHEREGKSLSNLIFDTVTKSDINFGKKFLESIVASGGTRMFSDCQRGCLTASQTWSSRIS